MALTAGLCPPTVQGQNRDPEDAGTCPGHSCSPPPAVPYLGALVEEGVPDLEEDVADETVCEDYKEPVEGDEGQVHTVLPQVGHQFGQLLQEEVLQHSLVHLQAERGPVSCCPVEGAASVRSTPAHPAGPHTAPGCSQWVLPHLGAQSARRS